MTVYVSTTCLVNSGNVFEALNDYAELGLKNVELGVSRQQTDDLPVNKFRQYGFAYIVHHYFPPPRQPFIINLASQDAAVLARSREQVIKSLDFCQSLGIRLFSFHGGFRVDPDNGLNFSWQDAVPHEIAFNTFIESVSEINHYAQERGVRLAVENNVLARHNLVDGQNKICLFCEAEDFTRLWERIPSANMGILLDLGHLKVTSHWLGFDRYEFINRVKDRVFALHVHDNDGEVDNHRPLDATSWCLEIIARKQFRNLPLVLESWKLSPAQVMQQVNLIENTTGREQG